MADTGDEGVVVRPACKRHSQRRAMLAEGQRGAAHAQALDREIAVLAEHAN